MSNNQEGINIKVGVQPDIQSIAKTKIEMQKAFDDMAKKLATSESVSMPMARKSLSAAIREQEKAAAVIEKSQSQQTAKEVQEQNKRVANLRKMINDEIRIEEVATKKRASEAEKQIATEKTKEEKINLLRSQLREEVGGAIGGYQARHLMKMFRKSGELNEAEGNPSSGFMGNMGSLTSMIQPEVILPLMALGAATKIASFALSGIANIATDVVSALSQIGGAKNLQEMIISTASKDMTAAKIAGNSNLSKSQVFGMMQTTQLNSSLNDEETSALFSSATAGGGGRQLHKLNDILPGGQTSSNFLSKLVQTGIPAEQVGSVWSKMSTDMPNATQGQIQDIMTQLWYSKKQSGEDFFQNPGGLDRLRPESSALGIGLFKNLNLAAAVARGSGGKLDSKKSINELLKYEKTVGGIDNLANSAMSAGAAGVPLAIRNAASEDIKDFGSMSSGQQKDAIKVWIAAMGDATNATKELNRAIQITDSAIETRFKNAVNKFTIGIEGALEPAIQKMAAPGGAFDVFTTAISSHSQEIATAAQVIALGFKEVAVSVGIASKILKPSKWGQAILDKFSPEPEKQDIHKEIKQSNLPDPTSQHLAKIATSTQKTSDLNQRLLNAIEILNGNVVKGNKNQISAPKRTTN